jgi:hypothetical protein|tara:strand:- start:161 stop:481 length:321 start_codon:yes stop_codon:yes gene_type:complete
MPIKPLYINEDNPVEFRDLRNASTGELISDATLSAQVVDSSDVNVGSAVTCSAISGEDGAYRGVIPQTALTGLTDQAFYTVELTITSGSLDGYRKPTYLAQFHGEV